VRPYVYDHLTEILNRYRRDASSKGFDLADCPE
jgi:hypothetical protein